MTDEPTLRSGMKVTEAVKLASIWWDDTGRKLIRTACNEERTRYRVRTGGNAPGIVTRGPLEKVFSSRLMCGAHWDELDKREQMQIVKFWHYFYVLEPKIKAGELFPTVEELRLYKDLKLTDSLIEGLK